LQETEGHRGDKGRKETEGSRGDRGLLRKQRVIEGIECRREDRGP
jgi:hypothetical protein